MSIMPLISNAYEGGVPQNIDIALLRAFLAVVDTGGMTSSARVLNLTQAAISQQIKRLEDASEADTER
jgi:hypothetical protein